MACAVARYWPAPPGVPGPAIARAAARLRPPPCGFPQSGFLGRRIGCAAAADDENVDIDSLAAQLSQAANRLRESESDSSSDDIDEDAVPSLPSDVTEARASTRTSDIELVVGAANFQANDFVIFNQLGALAVQSMVSGSVASDPSSSAACLTRVNVFAATYESGMPFQGPVTVLLKEFPPGSRHVGLNELQLLSSLVPLPAPSERWRAASADPGGAPVVPVLGWFQSPPTTEVPDYEGPDEDSLWAVYKWEGLRPVQAWPLAEQAMQSGFRLFESKAEVPFARRCRMLCAIFRGSLEAIARLHAAGVVHGSLGSGSIMVNTTDDRRAGDLQVRVDNLGFGQAFVGGEGPSSGLEAGRRSDLQALAVTFCELVFSSLASDTRDPSAAAPTSVMFERLLIQVFMKDTGKFREYCGTIDEWQEGVTFLDDVDGGGWDLIDALLQGDSTCADMLESPFLNASGGW